MDLVQLAYAPAGESPRIYLAVERTLLAWIRTGLAMILGPDGACLVGIRWGPLVRLNVGPKCFECLEGPSRSRAPRAKWLVIGARQPVFYFQCIEMRKSWARDECLRQRKQIRVKSSHSIKSGNEICVPVLKRLSRKFWMSRPGSENIP